MRGGFRKGAGRPRKEISDQIKPKVKSIKFNNSEQYLLDYIENFEGNNFSDKIKKMIKEKIEKK